MSQFYDIFQCPICQNALHMEGKSLKCENHHSFDIASEGYVNLLTHGRAGAGDSKDMIAARHDFLQKGYYSRFRDALILLAAEIMRENSSESPLIVDAGCGEGYYLSGIYAQLSRLRPALRAAGVDLSAPAVRRSAKKDKNIAYAVASVFDLPLADESADILLNVFAPIDEIGFKRVLKRGGRLIIAAPGKRHLYGLKKILYENPYENDENHFDFDGFNCEKVITVTDEIHLETTQDILNLFAMTPYYWKTSKESAKQLADLGCLETTIEFEFFVLVKQ